MVNQELVYGEEMDEEEDAKNCIKEFAGRLAYQLISYGDLLEREGRQQPPQLRDDHAALGNEQNGNNQVTATDANCGKHSVEYYPGTISSKGKKYRKSRDCKTCGKLSITYCKECGFTYCNNVTGKKDSVVRKCFDKHVMAIRRHNSRLTNIGDI